MALRVREVDFDHCITSDQFEAMPEFEDGLHELLDGRIVVKAMPGDEHGWIAKIINRRVWLHDPDEKLGVMWIATSFRFSRYWNAISDLSYIVRERVPKQRSSGAIRQIPDLVVEIISPSDLSNKQKKEQFAKKLQGYREGQVKIVWVIYPNRKIVEVYHPDQEVPVRVGGMGDELEGEEVIKGFKLAVADLFNSNF